MGINSALRGAVGGALPPGIWFAETPLEPQGSSRNGDSVTAFRIPSEYVAERRTTRLSLPLILTALCTATAVVLFLVYNCFRARNRVSWVKVGLSSRILSQQGKSNISVGDRCKVSFFRDANSDTEDATKLEAVTSRSIDSSSEDQSPIPPKSLRAESTFNAEDDSPIVKGEVASVSGISRDELADSGGSLGSGGATEEGGPLYAVDPLPTLVTGYAVRPDYGLTNPSPTPANQGPSSSRSSRRPLDRFVWRAFTILGMIWGLQPTDPLTSRLANRIPKRLLRNIKRARVHTVIEMVDRARRVMEGNRRVRGEGVVDSDDDVFI